MHLKCEERYVECVQYIPLNFLSGILSHGSLLTIIMIFPLFVSVDIKFSHLLTLQNATKKWEELRSIIFVTMGAHLHTQKKTLNKKNLKIFIMETVIVFTYNPSPSYESDKHSSNRDQVGIINQIRKGRRWLMIFNEKVTLPI